MQETPLCQEQLCLSQTELTQRSFFKYVIAVVGVIKAITIVYYNIGVSNSFLLCIVIMTPKDFF